MLLIQSHKRKKCMDKKSVDLEYELELLEDLYELVVPKFREANDIVVSMLDFPADRPIRLLDLGCGFGHLSSRLLEILPNAKVFGFDNQPAILQRAQKRTQEYGDRFVGLVRDLNESNWLQEMREIDAIVSTFALDYLPPERHRQLIHEAAASLQNGGRWVSCEFFRAKDDRINRVFHDIEVQLVQDKLRQGEVSAEEIDQLSNSSLLRQSHYVVDVAQKLSWLQEAGLKTVDIPWKFLNLAIICAVK